MSPGSFADNNFEEDILEPTSELLSFLDFLPFEETRNSDSSEIEKNDYSALNGDDKFLDSIIKGFLDSTDNSKDREYSQIVQEFGSVFSEDSVLEIDSNIFKNDAISVLGVDLDLYSNNNVIVDNFLNNDLDNIFNETDNDLDLDFSTRVNDFYINTQLEYNKPENETIIEQHEIINMFPHIYEERNRRRRSLIYESTFDPNKIKEKSIYDEKIYRKNDALLSHDYTQKKSEDEKYFPCPMTNCEKVYAKSSHLKAHLRRHSGEKPFICNWQNCTWKFSRSDELARHKRSHSGIKPYKCELCEKAFARSDHLSKHKKVHKKKMAQCGSYNIKKRGRYN